MFPAMSDHCTVMKPFSSSCFPALTGTVVAHREGMSRKTAFCIFGAEREEKHHRRGMMLLFLSLPYGLPALSASNMGQPYLSLGGKGGLGFSFGFFFRGIIFRG